MKHRAMKTVAALLALLMLLGLAFAEGYDEELQLGATEDAEVLQIEDADDSTDEVAAELVDVDMILGADVVIEQPAEEQLAAEEPVEEEAVEEDSAEEEEAAEEESTEEEAIEEENAEDVTAEEKPEDETSADKPVANALTYNGEAQPLVIAQGAWLYSLDGENYSEDIPTAVDAGEYTVYFKAVEVAEDADAAAAEAAEDSVGAEPAEPEALTVTIAKADVTFTPPVAACAED